MPLPAWVKGFLLVLVFNLQKPVHKQKATKDLRLLAVQSKCLTYFPVLLLKHGKSSLLACSRWLRGPFLPLVWWLRFSITGTQTPAARPCQQHAAAEGFDSVSSHQFYSLWYLPTTKGSTCSDSIVLPDCSLWGRQDFVCFSSLFYFVCMKKKNQLGSCISTLVGK